MFSQINITTSALTAICCMTLVGGCCCKKYCPGLTDTSLTFHNFEQSEIDSVWVITHVANTNFTQPVDSFFDELIAQTTTWFPNGIRTDYEYAVKLSSSGATYWITDLETERTQCNDCFPYAPKDEFYQELSSYRVNGIPQQGSDIEIYK